MSCCVVFLTECTPWQGLICTAEIVVYSYYLYSQPAQSFFSHTASHRAHRQGTRRGDIAEIHYCAVLKVLNKKNIEMSPPRLEVRNRLHAIITHTILNPAVYPAHQYRAVYSMGVIWRAESQKGLQYRSCLT